MILSRGIPGKRFACWNGFPAYRWGEHYVFDSETKGAIKLDLFNCKGILQVDGKESYF